MENAALAQSCVSTKTKDQKVSKVPIKKHQELRNHHCIIQVAPLITYLHLNLKIKKCKDLILMLFTGKCVMEEHVLIKKNVYKWAMSQS